MKQRPARASKERGTLIVALMAGITIMVILSAVAAQKWSDVIRRDNEAEMMFRAQDITRALKRFQAANGKYPVELKELTELGPQGQYFLRKLWKDPLVKGGKWQLVYLTPTGALYDPTAPEGLPAGDPSNPSNPTFPPSPLNPQDTQGSIGGEQGGFPSRNNDLLNPRGDESGEGLGLPIAGVKSKCSDRPFRKYKEKDEYREWVFSIFDFQPQTGVPNPANSQNPGQPSGNPPPDPEIK